MKKHFIILASCLLTSTAFSASNGVGVHSSKSTAENSGDEHIGKIITDGRKAGGGAIILKDKETLATKAMFRAPVEISVVAKTDSTDLRMSFASDQVIFNYSKRPSELHVQGGPLWREIIQQGRGQIPENKWVTIKWVMLPDRQQIYVDGDLRFEHEGDYSKINKPLAVFTMGKAKVTVKSIKVQDLTEEAEPAAASK